MKNIKELIKLFVTILLFVLFNTQVHAIDLDKLVEDTKKTINQLNQNKNPKNTEQTSSETKPESATEEGVQNTDISKENDKAFVWGIQFNLNRTGYKVGFPDGNYNDKTRLAIEEFEKDRGLTVTGKPTELLAENLKKAVDEGYKKQNTKNNSPSITKQSDSAPNTSQQTSSQKPQVGKSEHNQIRENKDSVKHIQTRLTQMAYYKGDINGEYDKATYMAVKSFQVQRKLKNVGYLDFALVDELDKAYQEGHTINSEKEKYANWKPCNKLPETDDEETCYPYLIYQIIGKLEHMGYVDKFPHNYQKYGLHEKHRDAIKQFQKDRGLEIDGRATKKLANEIETAYVEYRNKFIADTEAKEKKEKKITWQTAKTSEEKDKACKKITSDAIACHAGAKLLPGEVDFYINECKSHNGNDATLKLLQECK